MSNSKTLTFAMIGDIHGNLTALDAVLADIEVMKETRGGESFELVCLGDSFDGGPDPKGVFSRLNALQCAHLRGNHEDYLFEFARNPEQEKFSRPLWKFIPWTAEKLADDLQRIHKISTERWRNETSNLIAVHGSWAANNRVPEFFSQQSALSAAHQEEYFFTNFTNRVVFNGHSHYLGQHRDPQSGDVWFNCGSVGYPFVEKDPLAPDAPLATWVWVEISEQDDMRRHLRVINRRVPYSADELLRRYCESDALVACAPFSFAIASQSLFNEDVVYPFFQKSKERNLTPSELAQLLVRELLEQNVFERINRMLRRLGFAEVRPY